MGAKGAYKPIRWQGPWIPLAHILPLLSLPLDAPSLDFTQFYLSLQNANLPQISAFYNIYKSSSFLDSITPLLKISVYPEPKSEI